MLIGSAAVGYRRPAMYDPSSVRWTTTSDSVVHRTSSYHGTVLADGSVLVVGGGDSAVADRPGYLSAERYDPGAGRWQGGEPVDTGGLPVLGLVTLSGGQVLGVFGTQARLFDPSQATWSSAGSLSDDHLQALVSLSDNRALAIVRTADTRFIGKVYDGARNSWTATAPFSRVGFSPVSVTATILADGRVLATGGGGPYGIVITPGVSPTNRPTNASYIFDPATLRWSAAPIRRLSRAGHANHRPAAKRPPSLL